MEQLNIIFPNVISLIIYEYIPKCHDCSIFKNTLFTCSNCKRIRCKFHQNLNTTLFQCAECYDIADIMIDQYINLGCIICKNGAYYGTEKSIKYCYNHAPTNNIIYVYDYCSLPLCRSRSMYINDQDIILCEKHAKVQNITKRHIRIETKPLMNYYTRLIGIIVSCSIILFIMKKN